VTDDDLAPAEDSLAEGFFAEEESREIDPEEIVPPSQQVEPAPPEARADEAADPDDHAETGREGDQGDERADEPEIANAAGADRGDDEQPVVLIPRSPEGVRQRRLFDSQIDEGLIEEAVGIARSSGRRVTAGYLQRKLRVDYEQAREVLQLLVQRGVIGDDEVADTERR
jgi:DNA segregation ATPase FtsK/SpoIIIE-like protein